jgi:hypothetical protein
VVSIDKNKSAAEGEISESIYVQVLQLRKIKPPPKFFSKPTILSTLNVLAWMVEVNDDEFTLPLSLVTVRNTLFPSFRTKGFTITFTRTVHGTFENEANYWVLAYHSA